MQPTLEELSTVATAPTLETMSRPMLDWLQRMTRFESTYLTWIDWQADAQEVLYSVNRGSIGIEEGNRVPWADTLCRSALENGTSMTDDVPTVFPDSQSARQLGLQSYISVPVQLPDGQIFGTLCGASSKKQLPTLDMTTVLHFFAQIIADRVNRERETERKQAEYSELQRQSERIAALERIKSEFLRIASHELRQPCTVISGYVEMLEQGLFGELDPNARNALGIIEARVVDLRRLLDQMLDIARLEDDRLELRLDRVDLRDIVRSAAGSAPALSDERHELRISVPDEPVPVRADRDRIGIVVSNLLSNALKYSPDGGAINCALRLDGGRAVVSVEDDGVGIEPGRAAALFERFSRVEDTAHRGIAGIGLGLHISRELVRRHGGDLMYEPRSPRGSCFRFWLPLAA